MRAHCFEGEDGVARASNPRRVSERTKKLFTAAQPQSEVTLTRKIISAISRRYI